jgi:uncharacterized DUF497 family protein
MPAWDEPKRLRNIKPRGLNFVGCEAVFDSPVVTWEDDREAYGEQRINLLGGLNGIVVHMTYTERGDEPHIISLRKAENLDCQAARRGSSSPDAVYNAPLCRSGGRNHGQ